MRLMRIVSLGLALPIASLLVGATPAEQALSTSVPITQLVMRDYVIRVTTDATGVALYDVQSSDGQPLASALTLAQLQAAYPTVYDSLRPAIAQDGDDAAGPIMMMHLESAEF